MFKNKHIVVGITGGIAAYKAAGLVSHLRQLGADVHCIMTEHATHLVTPVTFGELSGNPVAVEMFDDKTDYDIRHISLAELADAIVIAPCTANMIGKIAGGIADDMLSTTVMAARSPVILVPAMNTFMYENLIVQENLHKLDTLGYEIMEPDSGHLACNMNGKGRFPEIDRIIERIDMVVNGKNLLKGKKVIVTAGGTREAIDPVRFIGNRSSGKMGYAIARAARREGADVTLVTASSQLKDPYAMRVIHVSTAGEMKAETDALFEDTDIVVMAAAVADYRPEQVADQKIKKEELSELTIHLTQNPDILRGMGDRKTHQFLAGFAAETNDVITHGKDKLHRKNLDMLIANDVSGTDTGFNSDNNKATLLFRDGTLEEEPVMTKARLGQIIIEKIAEKMYGHKRQ